MKTETIAYDIDGLSYEGVLVYDPARGACPAVLMGPNWMGVTPEAIERARHLAADGRYTVFIADMYGAGKRPRNPEEAGALANPLREAPLESRKRIGHAWQVMLDQGRARGAIDPARRAAIGFCFGGGNVLDLARDGADVQAVVSIHGDLASPMTAGHGDIKGSVLVIHGAADPVAPKAQRDALEAELEGAGCPWRMLSFGHTVHAFTDPGVNVPGIAVYDARAEAVTFDVTFAFLAEVFSRST